jgi:D-glycero-beta-D-manno-heptose 1-phosphate adenylyltransferase
MIISFNDLAFVRDQHSGQKLVLTSGTFDLFHAGHLGYLEQVKKYGDVVIVLLSGDNRVKARKGVTRPVIPEQQRARILDALKIVDYVLIDPSKLGPEETDPIHTHILEKLQPEFYVTDGPDPRFVDVMDSSKYIVLDRMDPEPSTTSIIARIKASK